MTIDDVDLSGKKILIVDDVFTTGSTVRAMIKLISKKTPKSKAQLIALNIKIVVFCLVKVKYFADLAKSLTSIL